MMISEHRIPVIAHPAGQVPDQAGNRADDLPADRTAWGQDTALVLGEEAGMPAGPATGPAAGPARLAVERLGPRPGGHAAGCPCCTPRAALALALHRLFLRRARGEVPFFRRVVVAAPPARLAEALADPLIASRFRDGGAGDAGNAGASPFRCE